MHLDVYLILKDSVKVVGVCDLDPHSATRLAERYRIASSFTIHMDMSEAARPDITDRGASSVEPSILDFGIVDTYTG